MISYFWFGVALRLYIDIEHGAGRFSMKNSVAKPFLKWAGGKTQLIPEIERTLPSALTSGEFIYIEPFVGSGAILFWMLGKYPTLKKAVINDINADLINAYRSIAVDAKVVVSILEELQTEYHGLEGDEERKKAVLLR